MKKWRRRLERSLGAALDACQHVAAPARGVVERGLTEVSRLLATPAVPSAADIDAAMLAAMRDVVGLAIEGRLDLELAVHVAAVFNAGLDRPDRQMKLREIVMRAAAGLPLLVASRVRPSSKTVARTRFAYTEVLTRVGGVLTPKSAAADDAEASSDASEPDIAHVDEPMPLRPGDVPVAPHAPVRLGVVRDPLPKTEFYELIVEHCAEQIALLARHRTELPWRGRRDEERRILEQVDAICAAGGDCVKRIARWWSPLLGAPDTWKTWAAAFALGSIEGPDALDAVGRGLERLPPTGSQAAATTAAEALLVAPHSNVITLARDLLTAPHPLARAVAIDVLSRRGALAPDELTRHLSDANVPVLEAALRAMPRLYPQGGPIAAHVARFTHFPHPSVAWAATRTLALWGRPEPYFELRTGGRIASTLAPLQALELFILLGNDSDLPAFEAILSRCAITSAHLSAVARFGHATSWAFLLHFLEVPDLADAASRALVTLFGSRVPESEMQSVAAWRAALTRMEVDVPLRYRMGEPWRPSTVAMECRDGALPRMEIENRLDELAVRLAERTDLDLRLWSADIDEPLSAFLATIERADGAWVAGSWMSKTAGLR